MLPADLPLMARRVPEELLTQGDAAAVRGLFAPGCRHAGLGGDVATTADLLDWVARLRRAVPNLSAVVDEAVGSTGAVAHRLTLSGTVVGDPERPLPGTRLRWSAIEWFRLGPDQRFTDHWLLVDWPPPLRFLADAAPARGRDP